MRYPSQSIILWQKSWSTLCWDTNILPQESYFAHRQNSWNRIWCLVNVWYFQSFLTLLYIRLVFLYQENSKTTAVSRELKKIEISLNKGLFFSELKKYILTKKRLCQPTDSNLFCHWTLKRYFLPTYSWFNYCMHVFHCVSCVF